VEIVEKLQMAKEYNREIALVFVVVIRVLLADCASAATTEHQL
jgi:hypothetical protein